MQSAFSGFGPNDQAVSQWRQPAVMPPDIVALCKDEAHAIRLSLDYAKRRHGLQRKDVARLMDLNKQKGRLSEWCRPEHRMPEKHRDRFCKATGCALLHQHIEDVKARKQASGTLTQRERDAAIVALMSRNQWNGLERRGNRNDLHEHGEGTVQNRRRSLQADSAVG